MSKEFKIIKKCAYFDGPNVEVKLGTAWKESIVNSPGYYAGKQEKTEQQLDAVIYILEKFGNVLQDLVGEELCSNNMSNLLPYDYEVVFKE